ncbi:ATP-binding cassette domain-containing protein [Pseudodonghicola flavimaris]|uniref:ATP-binding cassette domain-containing protein n=1 Tax=Pseudodonghicola flavimaris TaxID=3050036 RepID=A0ABT7F2E1_9RHOB|nr:ATP-binding cassette domain-containing protein [Pseudodonghicola flavimaris]MDK3018773.1 ATP-binding cassette domain-containing protein [Pseudodonghicola flavimaris]
MSMTPLLRVRDLHCSFRVNSGMIHPVRGVSFDLQRGETLALVGESGCGKTTLARALLGLQPPSAGSIQIEGNEIAGLNRVDLRRFRPQMQCVFQDPFSSLNPRKRVETLIREPLDVHQKFAPEERRRRVHLMMEKVGLPADWGRRFPHEFSGGQRQRIGIARALILQPDILICDEPVSALDVSVQAQIINLLYDLKSDLGVSYLFISHDLTLVETFADRVAMMFEGQIVETGPAREVWCNPQHAFTRRMIDAIPVPDVTRPAPPAFRLEAD